MPKLILDFNEKPVFFREVEDKADMTMNITDFEYNLWQQKHPNDRNMSHTRMHIDGKNSGFTRNWIRADMVCPTLTTSEPILFDFPRKMNEMEIKSVGSFPKDYKAPNVSKLLWLCGMSVPPVMTANIAHQIYLQWLSKI